MSRGIHLKKYQKSDQSQGSDYFWEREGLVIGRQPSGVADKILFLDLGSDYKDAPLLINHHMVKEIDRNRIFFIHT